MAPVTSMSKQMGMLALGPEGQRGVTEEPFVGNDITVG